MRTIIVSHQFKKDLKLAIKRNLPQQELYAVVRVLANDVTSSEDKHDHSLTGNYVGYRECHILPDWFFYIRRRTMTCKC